eukprot:13486605-Ditylum_brightwellii.AAC.1
MVALGNRECLQTTTILESRIIIPSKQGRWKYGIRTNKTKNPKRSRYFPRRPHQRNKRTNPQNHKDLTTGKIRLLQKEARRPGKESNVAGT